VIWGLAWIVMSRDTALVEPMGIPDIDVFLETCPTEDPAYDTIRAGFRLLKDGVLVGDLECTGCVLTLPIEDWTDELIAVQTLRAIFHMSRGTEGRLPWTELSLYDWLKSQVGGINIDTGVVGGSCCSEVRGVKYFRVGTANDSNRNWDRTWEGISGNVGFYVHEARHLTGPGHVSCCGITNGCDQVYDEENLASYAIQWWLNWAWLTGTIDIGLANVNPDRQVEIAYEHIGSCNNTFRERICESLPPEMSLSDLLARIP